MKVFNKQQMTTCLPCHSIKQLPLCWQDYCQFYRYDELLQLSELHIGCHSGRHGDTVYQHFKVKQAVTSKGTCVIVHGYMDHSALYRNLILDRLKNGWDVLIYDKYGHGLSDGEPLAIESFSQYASQLSDLLTLLESWKSRQPWLLIGQSTGGAVVLEHLLNPLFKDYPQITQRVLLAPLVECKNYLLVKCQYYFLRLFIKQISRKNIDSSHDQDFLHFINQQDPLIGRFISVKWVGAMIDWVNRFEHFEQQPNSILIIQGDGDNTLNWANNLAWLEGKLPNAQSFIVKGAKHHLVNEQEKMLSQVLLKLNDFCNE